jgi:hypothetical protein
VPSSLVTSASPVDARDDAVAARIVEDLGIASLRLLTNNPRKVEGLRACGIELVERVPLPSRPGPDNLSYLRTKRDRMGHALVLPACAGDACAVRPRLDEFAVRHVTTFVARPHRCSARSSLASARQSLQR